LAGLGMMYKRRGRERRLFLVDHYYCYNPGWYGVVCWIKE